MSLMKEAARQANEEQTREIRKVVATEIEKLRNDLIALWSGQRTALCSASSDGDDQLLALTNAMERLDVASPSSELRHLLSDLQNEKASRLTLLGMLRDGKIWKPVLTLGETLRGVARGVKQTQDQLGVMNGDAKEGIDRAAQGAKDSQDNHSRRNGCPQSRKRKLLENNQQPSLAETTSSNESLSAIREGHLHANH